jgi:glyoxylase-like metal-dependent hydrolase (beta-lactamase superfamily II)
MKIHHLNCGTMCPRGGRLLGGSGGPLATSRIVAHCLLIEAGGDLILVDTGFGTGDIAEPRRMGQPFRAIVRPVCAVEETAVRQIEALGLDPGDVRHIAVTHLDVDHAGGLGDFPEAEVHVFEPELAAAQSPPRMERARYASAQWAHGPRWVAHQVDGDTWFGFDSVRLLPGLDPEVALVPLVGHSTGHTGIAIRTAEGWLLHCGDAFFHRGEIATPPSCPVGLRVHQTVVGHDRRARIHNQERLRELAREHPDDVRLICSHDPEQLEQERAAEALTSA